MQLIRQTVVADVNARKEKPETRNLIALGQLLSLDSVALAGFSSQLDSIPKVGQLFTDAKGHDSIYITPDLIRNSGFGFFSTSPPPKLKCRIICVMPKLKPLRKPIVTTWASKEDSANAPGKSHPSSKTAAIRWFASQHKMHKPMPNGSVKQSGQNYRLPTKTRMAVPASGR